MNPSPPTQNAPTFEEKLVGLYPRLLQAALYLCGDQADAHDLVQDAIERGLRCRDRFCSGDAPEPWMLTIIRRLFIDRYRAQRARARHLPRAASEPVICAETPTPCPWERFTTEDVRHASQLLAPLYREVFTLFTFDKLSQRQIARRLSLSASTVATRLVRARHKLRALMESGSHQSPTPGAEKPTEGSEKSRDEAGVAPSRSCCTAGIGTAPEVASHSLVPRHGGSIGLGMLNPRRIRFTPYRRCFLVQRSGVRVRLIAAPSPHPPACGRRPLPLSWAR
ncbi:MAG: RNA polymerase sigma factor [Polyangia bacterium]